MSEKRAKREQRRREQEAAERYEGRESESLCEMYVKLAGAYSRYRVGARGASLEQLMAPPTTAARRVWHCGVSSAHQTLPAAATGTRTAAGRRARGTAPS